MAELLNCPMCGNDVNDDEGCFQVSGFRPPSTPAFSVRCGNPSCNAEVTATSRDEAIAAWNRRTPPPQAEGGEPATWQFRMFDPDTGVGRDLPWMEWNNGPSRPSSFGQWAVEYRPLWDHQPAVGQEWEKVVRAWRNRFISERTGYYQAQGQCYEEAIASAEYDANCYADGLVKAGIGATQ